MARVVATALCLASIAAAAQTPVTATPASRLCLRSKPTCQAFIITELGLFFPLIATPSEPGVFDDRHQEMNLSVDVGYMRRRGRSAIGGLASLGSSESGTRLGVLGRHRRRLTDGINLDLTAGVIRAHQRHVGADDEAPAFGLTSDVGLGWNDIGHLVLRGDWIRANDRTIGALYVGGNAGTTPSIVATLGVLVSLAMLFQGTR